MNEKEKTEETTEDPKDTFDVLAEAKKINEEKARLLEKEEELLERKERLQAAEMVGGKSKAAAEQEKPKEETPEEYAKRVIEGGLN